MTAIAQLVTPPILHAMTVHLPIGLAIFGVPLVYLCAAVTKGRGLLHGLATAAYVVLAGCAYLATVTGGRAHDAITAALAPEVLDLIERHQFFAEQVWIFALVTAALVLLAVFRAPWLRVPALGLAMVACLATAGWVAVTAHYGGTLVYQYGVGTPALAAAPAPEMTEGQLEALVDGLDAGEAARVSYAGDVGPLLEKRCGECHDAEDRASGLDLSTYAGVLAGGQKAGPAIAPGDPAASPLIQYVFGLRRPRMPKGEPPLPEAERRLLLLWIRAGAANDAAALTE